jgi:hypothetical protein
MDKPIAHFIITKVLLILCAAVTAPFWYPAAWLASDLEARTQQNVLGWAIRVCLVVWFFCMYWFSKRMSHHMTIEGKTFVRGVKDGLLDARLHLAFLPLVGDWFMPEEDKRNYDTDEDNG